MKKVVLTFGLLSGAIIVILMFATMPLQNNPQFRNSGHLIGYTTMVIAFSMIFFAVKSYRDQHQNGEITFGKGMQIGLLITVIASLSYAIGWEFYMKLFAPNFMEDFTSYLLAQAKESGKSEAELNALVIKYEGYKEMYKNPVSRFGMTLMEIAPVGIILSVIPAALLRKKKFLPADQQAI
jgi:hypothetical protein